MCFEVCDYFEDPPLYQVTSDFLRSFYIQTSSWGPKVPLCTPIQMQYLGGTERLILQWRRLLLSNMEYSFPPQY